MLLFKGFFVSLPLDKGLVSSNNFYYCRSLIPQHYSLTG